jgi:hypothetical protein
MCPSTPQGDGSCGLTNSSPSRPGVVTAQGHAVDQWWAGAKLTLYPDAG